MDSSPLGSSDPGALRRLLNHRRSTKSYQTEPISSETLDNLLSAALQRTPERRPYGSAYARYEVSLTVIAARVEGLAPAAYLYNPITDELRVTEVGDHCQTLAGATYDADWLRDCPASLLLSADLTSADAAFAALQPGKGTQFCYLEAGLVTQNVHLWAAENSLGTVFLGGLRTEVVENPEMRALIPEAHSVLGILPLGYPAD